MGVVYNPYFFGDVLHKIAPAIYAIVLFVVLFQTYKLISRRLGGSDNKLVNGLILLLFVVAFLGGVWAILQSFPAWRVIKSNLILW
jgi:hypothetical protein